MLLVGLVVKSKRLFSLDDSRSFAFSRAHSLTHSFAHLLAHFLLQTLLDSELSGSVTNEEQRYFLPFLFEPSALLRIGTCTAFCW